MRVAVAIAAAGWVACADPGAPDPEVEALEITGLAPATIVPGTRLVVRGAAFVDAPWGETTLHLHGRAGDRAIDTAWPATFVDATTLALAIDRDRLAALGGDGTFRGTATVEVVAAGDRRHYATAPLDVGLTLRSRLAPATPALPARGVIFVDDAIELSGDGFLLGGDEGTSAVQVAGCFTPAAGGACRPVAPVELPLAAVDPSRGRARFVFSPRIAGIQPGAFTGTIAVVNRQPGEPPVATPPVDVAYDLVTAQVFSVDPPAASLGQYVFVRGGGFVSGAEPGAVTELELSGTLRRSGGAALPLAMTLIPEVLDGRLARYVINTDDALGRALDLRSDTAELAGSITPVVSFGGARVRGQPTAIRIAIAPVQQVVYLQFEPSYVEGLRDFGLGAVDGAIRDRILAACREAYRGVNIAFRADPPADFALFSTVDLIGIDPNDQGLFGYDNSPGKDSGNLRLYDRLGGVNAQTQEDGYPGFGGVFVRSLMGFSQHPGRLARPVAGADPVFDQLFDPFRPDRGGTPVAAADLAGALPAPGDGAGCPARDRARQIQCAIFVLGNLIGGTVAHEIGHSLGLANPYQDGFHDPGDAPNRLMDAGEARPFLERAQLMGQGPAVFCDGEYAYLRRILPAAEPGAPIVRPGCS